MSTDRSTYPSKVREEALIRFAAAVPRSKHSTALVAALIRFATDASRLLYSTALAAVLNHSKALAAVLNR